MSWAGRGGLRTRKAEAGRWGRSPGRPGRAPHSAAAPSSRALSQGRKVWLAWLDGFLGVESSRNREGPGGGVAAEPGEMELGVRSGLVRV